MLSNITVVVTDPSNQPPSLPEVLLWVVIFWFLGAMLFETHRPTPKPKSYAYNGARSRGASHRQAKRVEKWHESNVWMRDIAAYLAGERAPLCLATSKSREEIAAAFERGRKWMESYPYNARTGKRLRRGEVNKVPAYDVVRKSEDRSMSA